MNKKKLIIIGPAFPYRGGIANFNNALARTYYERGDDVIIYSFSLQYPDFLFPGTTQYETGNAPKGLDIRPIINSINPLNWMRTAREINNHKPDFVIIRYWLPFMAPCLGSIARLLNNKIKILSITDNIIPHEKRFGDTFLTRYFVKSCDAFITLSESVLFDLKDFTDTKFKKFIPHPIYDIFGSKIKKITAINNLNLDSKSKYLLFFGFIRDYKGLDLLLKAMADNRVRQLNVNLIIAGEFYENKQKYIDLISELGINSNIILRNKFISNDKVKDYFCAADMITQTYRSATQSGVTQIAYSFDRPMLVTDVGGLSEIVPHNKVGYVTSKIPFDIASAIVDFYTHKKEELLSANVKEEKKRFLWSNFVNDIDELMISFHK